MNLPPTQYLIWGGAGLAVLFLLLIGWSLGGGGIVGGSRNVKFNLTESQRKRLFSDLVGVVDNLGHTNKACRKRWQELQDQYGVNDEATREIIYEGCEHGWPEPNFEHVGQGHANRQAWIRARGDLARARGEDALKSKADPLLQD